MSILTIIQWLKCKHTCGSQPCTDPKLKEELLKLGQPDINGDPTEPITSDLIWNAMRNFEQRMKCLRSEGDEVAINALYASAMCKRKHTFFYCP